MVSGKVMSREEFVALLEESGLDKEQVREWKQDNRGDHTLQLNIVCEDHSRALWISFRDLERYRAMNKSDSAALASVWPGMLMHLIESGKPEARTE